MILAVDPAQAAQAKPGCVRQTAPGAVAIRLPAVPVSPEWAIWPGIRPDQTGIPGRHGPGKGILAIAWEYLATGFHCRHLHCKASAQPSDHCRLTIRAYSRWGSPICTRTPSRPGTTRVARPKSLCREMLAHYVHYFAISKYSARIRLSVFQP